MADIEIHVGKRHGVDQFTRLGWRDLTIKCDIGEITAQITDDGTFMDGIQLHDIPKAIWDGIQAACRQIR